MSQRTVLPNGMAVAIAGQLADTGPHDIITGFSAESTLSIPWGFGLRKAASGNPQGHVLPTGTSGTFEIVGVNILRYDAMRQGSADADGNYAGEVGSTGLLPKAMLEVGRKGRAYVPVEVEVRDGDRAYCRIGPGGASGGAGIWGGTGISGMIDCRKQAVFRSNTVVSADGTSRIAVLEFDFTASPV